MRRHSYPKIITIHLPEAYLEGIERLVQRKIYGNRSEAIRVAIRDLLKIELWDGKLK
nr:ribbon-helix-helix domain-containing protein [Candidatus Njordarchaeota archaeon]